ncbi:coiled-coil domain-containing protein 81-like isoform X2 [Clytia hemisphaerica]|uniref:CCDC81 HU domain-containing protein n=1 Tax=Clytia hemisphaerica TaxID=252671 RepID=A0A7M5UN90_9CNID
MASRQECMNDLIKTARGNKFSSLRKLASNEQEVYNIWDTISQLVEKSMEQRKAVHIPGLGVFTFTSSKLDVGHNKYILIQRPVFILSEKLAKTHRLTQSKYHVPGEIPVIQLNFAALAIEINVSRDLVEASVKEVVNALSRAIDKMGACEISFSTIGNLVISNGAAKMKFLPVFLEKMDNTGHLSKFLTQRPETSSSILSDNSLLLPKIQPGDGLKTSKEMPVIREEDDSNGGQDNSDRASPIRKENTDSLISSPKKTKEIITPTMKVEPRSPRIQQLTISEEHSKPNTPNTNKRSPFNNLKRTVAFKEQPVRNEIESKQSTRVFPTPRPSQLQILNQLKKNAAKSKDLPEETRCANCVENMNDFCYLCYQRERRNVPIYYTEERKKEEEEDDHLLQMYTLLKDKEAFKREEESNNKKRDEAQDIARFNMSASETQKKKYEPSNEFQRSFVFRSRPITPPHYIKQEDYQTDLARQVSDKRCSTNKSMKDKDRLERLEQLELAEDLAIQREHYWKSKRLQSDQYRKALDTQMSFKTSELPASYPDSEGPVFGVYDLDFDKLKERRKGAQNLYQNQMTMASEKRNQEMMRNVRLRREEENMLKRTKLDLLQETLMRNQANLKQRQDLEKTWARQAIKKRGREIDDKLRDYSAGMLLQEQCDKYKRCGQCTRHTGNYGQSNVWSETRYVSGSRLMV